VNKAKTFLKTYDGGGISFCASYQPGYKEQLFDEMVGEPQEGSEPY
jgi:hypothetical protein